MFDVDAARTVADRPIRAPTVAVTSGRPLRIPASTLPVVRVVRFDAVCPIRSEPDCVRGFPGEISRRREVLREGNHQRSDDDQSDTQREIPIEQPRDPKHEDRCGKHHRGREFDRLDDAEFHGRRMSHRVKRAPFGVDTLSAPQPKQSSMFTGIIEETGEIVDVTETEGGRRLRIDCGFESLEHGQSISVNGVCLTVEEYEIGADRTWFTVFLATETVEKTYLGEVQAGDAVNLERALRADSRFDGHIVQGHVDTTAQITAIEQIGDDWRFEFTLPSAVSRYIVSKGSIGVDGISLTVAERDDDRFAIAIIPTTYAETTLSEKAVGDPVHLEVDVVAKYVESMTEGYL